MDGHGSLSMTDQTNQNKKPIPRPTKPTRTQKQQKMPLRMHYLTLFKVSQFMALSKTIQCNSIYFRGDMAFYLYWGCGMLPSLNLYYRKHNKGKDELLCVTMMDVISFTQQLLNIWCISCANCGIGGIAIGSLNLIINLLSQRS